MTERKEIINNTLCRICLQSSEDDGLSPIFEHDPANPSMFVYEKIEECAGVEIIKKANLPSNICKLCNAFLTISYKFRTICRNSENYLYEFVRQIDKNAAADDSMETEYLVEFNDSVEDIKNPSEDVNDGSTPEVVQNCENCESAELWPKSVECDETKNNKSLENDEELTQNSLELRENTTKILSISPGGAAIVCENSSCSPQNKYAQKHICEICGKIYTRRYALEVHLRRHRNEKRFECEICSKTFHLNFELTRHMRKHTGQSPHQYCKRSLADRSTPLKHERIHQDERLFICETCKKSFTYASVLKVHMLTHTKEKPFKCGMCGKRFAGVHHLRVHSEALKHHNNSETPHQLRLDRLKKELK